MPSPRDTSLLEFALRMGDNTLILGQQVSAWCGHAPILEEDIALANVALDLIGQTKLWLGLAAELEGGKQTADDLAFLRDVRAFRNCLLVEQPNNDFGHTLMRQFLFDAWHVPMLTALKSSSEPRVAEIAEKSLKEATYHLERSEDLIIRLGAGTQESHDRMQSALDALWPFAAELSIPDAVDIDMAEHKIAPDLSDIAKQYDAYAQKVFTEAQLTAPSETAPRTGGKLGRHSEGLGYLLADMQWLQRAYPGAAW